MSWVDDWWEDRRKAPVIEAVDKGYLALQGTATGQPTIHPWSAVAGARERLQGVFDLPNLRYQVYHFWGLA